MSKSTVNQLAFVRFEGLNRIHTACVLEVTTEGAGKVEEDVLLKQLQAAVTEWATQTAPGRLAYAKSCRDFNVGDLMQQMNLKDEITMNSALGRRLKRQGIVKLKLLTQFGGLCLSYDTHLVKD